MGRTDKEKGGKWKGGKGRGEEVMRKLKRLDIV